MRTKFYPEGCLRPRRAVAGFLFFLIASSTPVSAQVVFDGNLRPELDGVSPDVAMPGSPADYQVDAAHGRTVGGNLFHSFRTFSIAADERATFSGPAGLSNVIAAVTGSEASDIGGTLASTVVGADLWLINPNGVVFRENARLEVKGGFHVSTADELRFPGGGVFSATNPSSNVLVAVDPSAFGFLDDTIAPIESHGALLVVPFAEGPADTPLLEVSDFTIAGGDILLHGAGAGAPESERVFVGTQVGDLRIASLASSGELAVDTLDTAGFAALGNVTLDEGLILSSSGVTPVRVNSILLGGSGTIDVVANDLSITDAQILSRTAVGGRDAGAIHVTLRGALTIASTSDPLTAGIQNVTAPVAGQFPSGDARGISVRAHTVELAPGTEISSSTAQFGDGGPIEIAAEESIRIVGAGADPGDRAIVFSNSSGEGRAGSIRLAAPTIELDQGGAVVVETRGKITPQPVPESEGNIVIGRSSDGTISTDRLILRRDARIDSSTRDLRPGGTIEISTRESVLISGAGQSDLTGITSFAQPESTATGSGGRINVSTPSLALEHGAAIAARSFGDGDAGAVAITAEVVSLESGSEIATESLRTAGGNISLDVAQRVLLRDSRITTSVRSGASPGGNIDIAPPEFVVLDAGEIRAQAVGGPGGNITIASDFFLADDASIVDASSEFGLDGEVVIRSPIADLSDEVEAEPARVGIEPELSDDRCAAAAGRRTTSSFVALGRETLPRSPDSPLVIPPAEADGQPPGRRRGASAAELSILAPVPCGESRIRSF